MKNSTFTILGSGFGLYGYLPALIGGCGQSIILPRRYHKSFKKRLELERFKYDIKWERDEEALLSNVEGIVLALRPFDQSKMIPICLKNSNINFLLLEKPLSQSPKTSEKLLNTLIDSRKTFRIGYTFKYTEWGKNLLSSFKLNSEKGDIYINWNFLAHHFQNDLYNWKRSSVQGGGVIRFYGIHLIALLSEIGYRKVKFSYTFGDSMDEPEKWIAGFSGQNLPDCEVRINTRSNIREFKIMQDSSSIKEKPITFANLKDPFESLDTTNKIDSRVNVLTTLCNSLWEEDEGKYEEYYETIRLWRKIETKTKFGINSMYN